MDQAGEGLGAPQDGRIARLWHCPPNSMQSESQAILYSGESANGPSQVPTN